MVEKYIETDSATLEKHNAPVSVIIPCYCCSETLERAVMSVISQTQVPAEVIFIEDGSKDDGATIRTIQAVSEKIQNLIKPVIFLMKSNAGPSSARNAGWDSSTQPYIAFLDADDSWHPLKIELQLNWMLANPHADLTGHSSRIFHDRSDEESIPSFSQIKRVLAYDMLWKNPFCTRGVMLKQNISLRFPLNMNYAEDGYLWAQITCNENSRCYISPALLSFSYKADFGEGGQTKNLIAMEKGEMKIISLVCKLGKFNFLTKMLAFSWSMIRFFRRVLITYSRI